MYKIGVFPGKFLPPHRGHLNSIINAATKCEKLYVVVSDHPSLTKRLCKENNLKLMTLKKRAKWLSIELQGIDHVKVITLDETDIPEYPYGWEMWSERLKKTVPQKFEVIFGGELEYKEQHKQNFPNVKYEIFDYKRNKYPVSATKIRENPFKHWDYILGSARPFFTEKILITGSESCGKTTMTKYLGKIYHTSWAEEEGRYYSRKYLGDNDDVYSVEDFERIAYLQRELEYDALKSANKIVFFDTSALVTQFYLEMYLNKKSNLIEKFIDHNRYDKVLIFKPDVKWVADGYRWNKDHDVRLNLHNKLKDMYIKHGFNDKIIEVGGSYSERLLKCQDIVDNLLNKYNNRR